MEDWRAIIGTDSSPSQAVCPRLGLCITYFSGDAVLSHLGVAVPWGRLCGLSQGQRAAPIDVSSSTTLSDA